MFLALVNNSNLSTVSVGMQSLLVMRCLIIAESDVAVFAFVPGARLSYFSDTCCLILHEISVMSYQHTSADSGTYTYISHCLRQ